VHGYLNGEHEFCPTCDNILLEQLNANTYEKHA